MKALKQQLNQQAADNDRDDPQDPEELPSDPDRLPPESEEENEVTLDLSASVSTYNITPVWSGAAVQLVDLPTVKIRRISTVNTKSTAQVANKPRIRRREGSVPPNLSPQPPRSTLESVGGNTVSEAGSAPAQPGPVASNAQGGTTVASGVHMVRTYSNRLTLLYANHCDAIWLNVEAIQVAVRTTPHSCTFSCHLRPHNARKQCSASLQSCLRSASCRKFTTCSIPPWCRAPLWCQAQG